jgi:alcohol dehydrogenase YqhD (iron-dependent ADH family)
VCCLARDGERRRRLLIDLALRPTTALLDPRLTRGLSATARLEAVMEIFLRLLVPYLTDPVERPVQDAITLALLRATIEQGRLAAEPEAGGPDGDGARLALAQLAAASHVAWANIGRPVGGHVLWYLANPVAPLAAVPKMTAVTAITSAYLEAVACELDRALGSAARLARVAAEVFGLDEEPRAAAAAVKALLCEWRLPRGLDDVGMGDVDPPLLTRAAYELWGAPELLGRITPTSCDAIYQAAQCRWSICEEQEGQTCTT